MASLTQVLMRVLDSKEILMNENQRKQIEEARREAIEKTYNVNATGEKSSLKEFDDFSNQINDE